MGSGKGDPMLHKGTKAWLLQRRQTFSKILAASTLSLALSQIGAIAQPDNKKPSLEPVAATSPAAKSAMGEPPSKQAQLPKPESAKSSPGSKGAEAAKSAGADNSAAADKSNLPFPVVSNENVSSLQGVQPTSSHVFPSAIDIHGSAAGVLLHARKETRYDLLSPLSIWLEDGPLLVSVRRPSEMVLVATKFGDVCVTAGGDAIVERGEEDTLRIVNLCTNGDTVFLNMHDKLWTGSPWGHLGKREQPTEKKRKGSKKSTYEEIESGAISIAPGYELVIGAHGLSLEDVKPPDSVGRRDFKTLEGGRFAICEISVDHITQLHDLIKNLNNHGEKANGIFAEIMKNAGMLKSRQGESGFEKNIPPPPKPIEPKRKPPGKLPPSTKPPAAKPPAPAATKPTTPGASTAPASPATKPSAPAASTTSPVSSPTPAK